MINFQFTDINLFAVLLASIIHIVLGLIWFQPILFGNIWSKLTGKDLKPASFWIIPMIIGHFLMIFVLVILIKLANSNNGLGGLIIGLLTWIGFIVPMEMGELVWEKIPFKLFLIRVGNQFVGLAVAGFILGAWR
jgi:Na+/proline symporter